MTRTKKLKPVVAHVDKHEQTALKAVAFSQRQLQIQQDRLLQLQQYKKDYATKKMDTAGSCFSAVQFQEFNRFISQLDETIKQQQNIVEMASREVDMKRKAWELKRSRSEAMHKVVDRIKAGEMQQAHKIEQKYMDEIALRLHMKES
jgi:flagellar FliJ protein